MANIYTSADQLIGKTPLLELTHIEKAPGLKAKVLAKLEYFNPAGSVKDRVAKAMIDDAEEKGLLKPGSVIIEPSLGVERSVLAVLCDAYDEEVVGQDKKGNDDVRVVLHFHPALAPFKAAILPLSKKDVLAGPAMELYNELSKEFMVDYDETGSIGKRYRREDEIGTPYCITFDFDTVGDEANGIAADHCVTIRERDSMEQVRIPIDQVKDFLREKCAF